MKRWIVTLTIVCVLCSSLEMSAFAQTAAEETGISQEQIQQTVSSGEITVSDGDNLARSMASNLEMEATDESFDDNRVTDEYSFIANGSYPSDTVSISSYVGTEADVVIPNTIDGYKVTSIVKAFWGCRGVTSVVIPEGVTGIYGAFEECSSLKSVTLPEGLTTIGDRTFRNCSELTSINIPKGVTSIGQYAFEECSSLKSVTLQEGLTKIGELAFRDCSQLTSINIPKGVTRIGHYAFYGCSSLKSINLPEGLTCLETATFRNSGLTSIDIPESITEIHYGAFYGCSDLKTVYIPVGVSKIEDRVFFNCESLKDLYYGGTEEQWNNITKGMDIGLDNVTIHFKEQGEDVTSVTLNNEEVTINKGETCTLIATISPVNSTDVMTWSSSNSKVATVSNDGLVTAVAGGTTTVTVKTDSGATATCKVIVKIPATSVSLDSASITLNRTETYALQAVVCPADTTDIVTWSSSNSEVAAVSESGVVTAVANGTASITATTSNGMIAFCEVIVKASSVESNLEYIIDESGNAVVIGYIGYSGGVVVPDTLGGCKVTEIGDEAFRSAPVSSVKLPNGLVRIGENAFYQCDMLRSIDIPEGVTEIGDGAFYGCDKLTSLELPEGLTRIGNGVFYACGFQNIELPESITTIGNKAFEYCTSLEKIVLPEGVTTIGSYAFKNCRSLKSIKLSEGLTRIGDGAFGYCSSLTSVKIPDGVTVISGYVFQNCTNLKSIELPEGITKIGTYAFEYCKSLTSISIPERIVVIDTYAFGSCSIGSCSNLTDLYYSGTEEQWNNILKSEWGLGLEYVTIHYQTIDATEVTLSDTKISLNKGETCSLTATMSPADTTDTLTWSTSNAEVATVSEDGVVTAVGKGTATITVTTTSGVSATCEVTVEAKVPATAVTLDKANITMNKGETATLIATMNPEGTTDTLTWSTSDAEVATVSKDGVVTAVAAGTATITVTTTSGVTATCEVTVKVPATEVVLDKADITMNKGETATLIVTMSPEDTADALTWSTSNAEVATVSEDGVVTAVGKGTATVTVTTTSGVSATCEVTVKVPATEIALDRADITMNKGETVALTATMNPEDTTDTLTWSTSNAEVATVSEDGVVTAVGKGTATITVTATSGVSATCEVTVEAEVPATEVTLNVNDITINKGETYSLIATMNPVDTTDTLTWSTSNGEVATVSEDGVVTAVGKGTATITVTTTSGVTASCEVTVEAEVPATEVTLNVNDITMNKGETATLTATMNPEDTTDTLTWSTSNDEVATVSEEGVVTAVAKGTAIITVTTTGGVTASCEVTVEAEVPATEVALDKANITMNKGETATLTATMSPEDTTDTLTWSTSNAEVATVSEDGVVTAVAAGTVTITVTTTSGVSASCEVVVKVPATEVALDKADIIMNKGETVALTATMNPKDTTDTLTWSTSNNKVATVSEDGVVSAVGKGTATITVTSTSGVTASCEVTVKVPATEVALDKADITMNKGETVALTATMNPEDTTATLTWSTSNAEVATVSEDGVVTAVANGTAIITVTTTSGVTATCEVTVKVPATEVALDKADITMNKGETVALTATMNPTDTTDTLTWSTSNAEVATVSEDGVVTAVAAGTATITVTTTSGVTATCEVTVKVPATEVTLDKANITMNKGETSSLVATMNPTDTTDTLTWSTSNAEVATVSEDGVVTAVAAGTATITVITTSGVSATCEVTVEAKVPATSVTVNKSSVTMNKGETSNLVATMNPADTTDTLTWSTSNNKVATVSKDGVVTAVGKGTATITVTTTSGVTATCAVTVKVPATSVTVNKSSITMNKGETSSLVATMNPTDTTDTLTWSTSNSKVATVSEDGVVTAVANGTATITVTTTSGVTATCEVTVLVPNVVPEQSTNPIIKFVQNVISLILKIFSWF